MLSDTSTRLADINGDGLDRSASDSPFRALGDPFAGAWGLRGY